MRPRSAGRFLVAVVLVGVAYGVGFPALLTWGGHAGGWGVVLAFLGAGFAAGLLFTAVYDGPRALLGLIRPGRRTSGTRVR